MPADQTALRALRAKRLPTSEPSRLGCCAFAALAGLSIFGAGLVLGAYREAHSDHAPCAMDIRDAHAEDDQCSTWIGSDGHTIVLGPLWARP